MHTCIQTDVCVGPWDYSYGIRIGVNYIFNVTFHLILYFHTVCDFHFISLFSSSTQTTRRKQQQNARERNRRPKSDGIQQHADSSIMGDEVSHFVLFSRDFFFSFFSFENFSSQPKKFNSMGKCMNWSNDVDNDYFFIQQHGKCYLPIYDNSRMFCSPLGMILNTILILLTNIAG